MTDADRARYLLALKSPPTHQAALGPPILVFNASDCLWGETQWTKLHRGGQGREERRVDDGGGGVGMAGIWTWGLRIICMLGRLGRGTCPGGRYCLAGLGEWGEYLKELSSTDLGTKCQRTGETRDSNLLGHFLCTRVRGALRGSKRGRHVPCSLSDTLSP